MKVWFDLLILNVEMTKYFASIFLCPIIFVHTSFENNIICIIWKCLTTNVKISYAFIGVLKLISKQIDFDKGIGKLA